ncbi:SDR family oxidoreductase [Actinophytocola sp.]|uniref:SDR family oxidoreductase n=1 Tax=Actinophytocola sp. TaxID=1872138 RepID=UPI00389A3AF0
MRVFVTGASGHIGSTVVPELIAAGHEVVGLARSEESAAAVKALGAEVRRGDLQDLDGLRAAAAEADAVVHLAFDHEAAFAGNFAGAAAADLAVAETLGDALAGTGKTLMAVGAGPTGDAKRDAAFAANPRSATSRALLARTGQGVRTLLVAVPQVVHGPRDRGGFVPTLIRIARATGVSGYVGDGANRWPATHALDLAVLYRLGLEKAPAGATLRAAAEQGVTTREIAEVIGRHLGVPAVSVPGEQVAAHFGAFAPFVTLDNPTDSAETRRLLGWEPVQPGLVADLDQGHYFGA